MESARLDGAGKVAELLKERSERSESAIRNALERAADDRDELIGRAWQRYQAALDRQLQRD